MTEAEILAEIAENRVQGSRLLERYSTLRRMLAGPCVEVVLHFNANYEVCEDCTIAEAFKRDDSLYGRPKWVSVGGARVTYEEWEHDDRNPSRRLGGDHR